MYNGIKYYFKEGILLMSSLTTSSFYAIYTLSTAEQLDLIYSKDGLLNLGKVLESMNEKKSTYK